MEALLSKSGIWTQHQDASGRTFYFNMVHGRSFWEIPDELKMQVKRPAIDPLHDWDSASQSHTAHQSVGDGETRRRREQVMLHAAAASASTGSLPPGMTGLHERMAQAAQRKKETEMRKFTEEKQREDESDAAQQASSSSEYLEMVRQLQHVDKETDSTGGKWLVR